MAPVDIILPFHGEHDKVGRLIESIFQTIHSNRYQISLVDDASDNVSFIKEFKKVPGVVGFRNEEQKGFGASINLALRNTKQPYVLILHSDVVVSGTNWLSNLGNSFNSLRARNNAVKMIAPTTNNPCGNDALRGEKGQERSDFVLGEGSFCRFIVPQCRRGLFHKLGLFKEYKYAGGEAEEFAARMNANGFIQGVSGTSWVQHEGRGTLRNYDKNKAVLMEMEKIKETVSATFQSC
jgi:glycosyltransferase involved in cell wall biosynthesis